MDPHIYSSKFVFRAKVVINKFRMSYTVGGINPTVVLVFQLEKIFISGVSWMTLVDVLVLMIGSLIGAFLGSRYFSNHYILHVNKWQ